MRNGRLSHVRHRTRIVVDELTGLIVSCRNEASDVSLFGKVSGWFSGLIEPGWVAAVDSLEKRYTSMAKTIEELSAELGAAHLHLTDIEKDNQERDAKIAKQAEDIAALNSEVIQLEAKLAGLSVTAEQQAALEVSIGAIKAKSAEIAATWQNASEQPADPDPGTGDSGSGDSAAVDPQPVAEES